MNYYNTNVQAFVEYFGVEALTLVKGHEFTFMFAETGDFAQADEATTESGGFVAYVNLDTMRMMEDDCNTLVMAIYRDRMDKGLSELPAEIAEKYLLSTLVHELEHVKQANDGRLKVLGFGHYLWEGKEYLIKDLKGYTELPWEVEAYMTQFMYFTDGNEAAALAAYKATQEVCANMA